MGVLCAVVPIGKNFTDFSSMLPWVSDCIALDIHLVLVRDSFDSAKRREFERTFLSVLKHPKVEVLDVCVLSPGLARNHGLERAREDWVVFWDCDDIPSPRNILIAIRRAGAETSAIIGQYSVNGKEKITQDIVDFARNPGHWRIVYRTNLVSKNRFKNYLWGEDQLFIFESQILESRVVFSDLVFYDYNLGLNTQLTYNARNSIFLRDVLLDFYTKLKVEDKHKDSLLPAIIMTLRMSITLAFYSIRAKRLDLLLFVSLVQVKFLLKFRFTWFLALIKLLVRK